MTPLRHLYEAMVAAMPDVDRLPEDARAAVRGAVVVLARELKLPCPIVTRRERRRARRGLPTP